MPVVEFLQTFLPVFEETLAGMPAAKGAFNAVPSNPKHESEMYKPLIHALNAAGTRKGRCPGFVFRDTSGSPDTSGGKVGSTKPDISCFAQQHLLPAETHGGSLKSRADMGFAATFIEVKTNVDLDFYADPSPDLKQAVDRDSHRFILGRWCRYDDEYVVAKKDFGQSVAYAVELCQRQHRCFCFSVAISGCYARLLRWDRAGIIVSESFDYVQLPQLLCEFFWRFGSVSDAARGYDMTVECATKEEEKFFAASIRAHIAVQVGAGSMAFSTSLDAHYKEGHVTAICLAKRPRDHDGHPLPCRRLLVSRPLTVPLSIAGSSTRAYWAVQVDHPGGRLPGVPGEVILLKDTWRLMPKPDAENEGKVLHDLKRKGVRNIPNVLDDEDVYSEDHSSAQVQETATNGFLDRKYEWVCERERMKKRVVARRHYRLLLDIAGYPLLHLSSTHELLNTAYDAYQAFLDAYKQNRLHRDMHPGNIVLYKDPADPWARRKGYLIDWDHSCAITTVYESVKRPLESDPCPPSLQWQFAAEELLRSTSKVVHEAQHDMESLLYVVLYCALLRLRLLVKPSANFELLELVQHFFDEVRTVLGGKNEGGEYKFLNKEDRRYTSFIVWDCAALNVWISALYHAMKVSTNDPPDTPHFEWTPEGLDMFWRSFLQERDHDLHRNDYRDNISSTLKNRKVIERYAPRTSTGASHQPTMTSSSRKRRAEDSPPGPSDLGRPRKLRRLDYTVSAVTAPPPSASYPRDDGELDRQ
ncbi:hypothetical protein BD414DRAFT_538928 [Trametes punicea]|nr:hypothetical protein BD414DRAFT_538928 [Trametes punicea]